MKSIKNVVFFGTGGIAEKFYNQHCNEINLIYCLDNDKTKHNQKFHGKLIYTPEDYLHKIKNKYLIIITSSFYNPICYQLIREGFTEYEDFIFYQYYPEGFNKKKAVIFGNCIANSLKFSLLRNKVFVNEYALYNVVNICYMNTEIEYNYLKKCLSKCDLFIHQAIRKENQYKEEYSSSILLKYISDKCKVVSVPNLVGLGFMYFPQVIRLKTSEKSFFRHSDININNMIHKNKSLIEIISFLNGEVYNKEYIEENLYTYIKKFEKREEDWDIKIMDYIKENYKTEKLFYDVDHPNKNIIDKISKRLIKNLGLKYDDNQLNPPLMKILVNEYEMLIYPCVYKHLDLKFDNNILKDKVHMDGLENIHFFYKLNFNNYIREYVNDKLIETIETNKFKNNYY